MSSLDSQGAGGTPSRRVVFFGDSRADWWPVPIIPGVQCLNRGLPGAGATELLRRFDAYVAPLKPAVIVIQMGVNDLVELAFGRYDHTRLVTTTHAMIEGTVAKARALGARIVLTTIFPLAHGLRPEPAVQAAIAEINQRLLALTATDVQVFDTAVVLTGPDGYVRAHYADDEVHLSDAGYAALNAELVKLL